MMALFISTIMLYIYVSTLEHSQKFAFRIEYFRWCSWLNSNLEEWLFL